MKKTLLVVLTLAALVALTFWADHSLKSSKPGARAAAATSAQPAPEFTIKALDGRDVSLAQYSGKVVLVNFWATWCGPCLIEIPWLIEFQQKYGPRGFTILGVAMDDEGKQVVEPWVQKERFDVNGQQAAINYPILIGNDAVTEKFGGLIGLPTSVLISRDGKRIKTIVGLANHEDLVRAIEGQL